MRDCDIDDVQAQALKCSICHCLLTDASFLAFCGHEFCDLCIRRWLDNRTNNNPACPICRVSATPDDIKPCRVLRKIIQQIKLEQNNECKFLPSSSQFDIDKDTAARFNKIVAERAHDMLLESECEDTQTLQTVG